MTQMDLALLAEECRGELPVGFERESQEFASLLETGAPVNDAARGKGSSNLRIRRAIVQELREFLCTGSAKYDDVRAHGRVISRTSLASVAGYVAGAVGISAGAAMACVAFIALAVANVGVGAFCRVTTPN